MTDEEKAEKLVNRLASYVGKDIPVEIEERVMDPLNEGRVGIKYKVYHFDWDFPLLVQLHEELEASGVDYRITQPNGLYTADYRLDRVNVNLSESPKKSGNFIISSIHRG